MKFTIVIPAYNEEKRIPATLGALSRYITDNTSLTVDDVEVIVVVNNTTDQTLEIVNVFSKYYPFIKAYNIPEKIGKGGAIKYGFEKAKGDYIAFLDADSSSSPIEVFKMLDALEKDPGAVAAIADRYSKESVIQGKVPFNRRVFSLGFRLLYKVLFGFKYNDTQCGLKVFRKEAGKFLMKENDVNGWTFDLNVLLIADQYKWKIIPVPTVWEYKPDSKLNVKKAMRSVPKEIFDAYVRYKIAPNFKLVEKLHS